MADDPIRSSFTDNGGSSETTQPRIEGGKIVTKAIGSAAQALAIARRLEQDDRVRDDKRGRVIGAFSGFPPYSESEMKAKGQSYRFNLSFGFMEGLIGRAAAPYLDMAGDVDSLIQIIAKLDNEKMSILEEEYIRLITEWGGWFNFVSREVQEILLFGYNTTIFPDDYTPWPVFVEQKDGRVPMFTQADVGMFDVFVWKKCYLIHELFEKIQDEGAAKKAGWNVENVQAAIMGAEPYTLYSASRTTANRWQETATLLRDGALQSSVMGTRQIITYQVFVREPSTGKITHWIVNDGSFKDGENVTEGNNQAELFKKEGRFDDFQDFIVYFDIEAGDGRFHGSRGLGQRGFNTHRSQDKLRCAILDQAIASGLITAQLGDSAQQIDFQLAVVGNFCIIPSGVTLGTATFPMVSQNLFMADSLLSNTSTQRVGDVVPNSPESGTSKEKTAEEVKLDAMRQNLLSKANIRRFISPISRTLSIMLFRLLKKNSPDKDAKKFQERLTKRGITPDDMLRITGVKVATTISDVFGESAQATTQLFAAFRNDPDVPQIPLKRRLVASMLSQKDAEELIPMHEDVVNQLEAARQQQEETAIMLQGNELAVSPRDFHEVHLQSCLTWLGGKLPLLMQGQLDIPVAYIDLILKHAYAHWQAMTQGPMKAKAAQYKPMLDRAAHVLDDYEKKAAQALAQSEQHRKDALQAHVASIPPDSLATNGQPTPAPAAAPELQPA